MSIPNFPAMLVMNVTFLKMPYLTVKEYNVYADIIDGTYELNYKTELIDTIINTQTPDIEIKKTILDSNMNATWKLPDDAYLSPEHEFRLFVDGFILDTLKYDYNRLHKLVTINQKLFPDYSINSIVEIEYYRNIITKKYSFENNNVIRMSVKPVFRNEAMYGDHNLIM